MVKLINFSRAIYVRAIKDVVKYSSFTNILSYKYS